MSVKKVYLTAEGARVASYAMNNNLAVNFTKFAIGSGENYNPSQATAMTKEDFQAAVTSIQRKGSNYWKVRGAFRNDELPSDLTFRELGLYVSDPENKDEEILYCYGNAKGDDFDFTEIIPAFTTSGNVSTRILDIDVYVQGDNATYFIDDTAKVDVVTVQDLRDDLEQEIADRQAGDEDAKNLENATGVLAVSKGGTGEKTEETACNKLLNGLSVGESSPEDNDYYISQFAGGSQDTYHRRPLSALWDWIQNKISGVFGLTASEYKGNSATSTLSTGLKTAGQNGWTPEIDTVNNWIEKGTCQWWFNEDGNLNNQLSTYGLLVNYVHGVDVHQFWLPQPNGSVYHRSGNAGAAFSDWIKFFDSSNINSASVGRADFAYRTGANTVYTCSTASETEEKIVSITGFALTVGACVRVAFSNGNNVSSPTLNVNSTGAKEIRVQRADGAIYPLTKEAGDSNEGAYNWSSNTILELMYNGTYWVAINNPLVQSVIEQSEMTNSYTNIKEVFFRDKVSYRVYLDGYKEQWGQCTHPSTNFAVNDAYNASLMFKYIFSSEYSYMGNATFISNKMATDKIIAYHGFFNDRIKLCLKNIGSSATTGNVYIRWDAKGY